MATIDSKSAVTALAALAQKSRLAVFRLLVTAGRPGMSAGAIAEALGLPPPSLSFHLKELSHAGLIDGHQQGRHVMYGANYDTMQALVDFLLENCCAAQECGCALNPTEA